MKNKNYSKHRKGQETSEACFDLEADGLLEEATKVHCLCIENPETGEIERYNAQAGGLSIEAGLQLLDRMDVITGHNILDYDLRVLKKLHNWEPKAEAFDTLVASRVVWTDILGLDERKGWKFPKPPEGEMSIKGTYRLEAFGVRLGILKGDFGKTTDWKEWSQSMEDYCVQDVVVTKALKALIDKKNYSQQCLDIEHAFAKIMLMQMEWGWQFNVEKAQQLYQKLSIERQKNVDVLVAAIPPKVEIMKSPEYYTWEREDQKIEGPTKKAITIKARELGVKPLPRPTEFTEGPLARKEHPFNPGSRPQIAAYLQRLGWKPRKFTKGGAPKVNEDTIGGLKYPHVDKILRYLMLDKRCSQIAEGEGSMLNSVHEDGRMYGYINSGGTVTGRCTHSRPNVAQTPNASAEYGLEFRECYEAQEGWELMGCDGSGLELRCLAHYLVPFDGGDYVKELLEGDIHTKNQEAAGLPTRDNAKTFIYGFLYGAGDGKIGEIIGKGRKAGREIKKKFFAALPAIKDLKDEVESTVKQYGSIIGWDGRILNIRSPHSALNFLLQSLGAIIMKQSLIEFIAALEEDGLIHGHHYGICGNIHDEFQIEFHKDRIVDRLGDDCSNDWEVAKSLLGETARASICNAGVKLNLRCPLDGEYKWGANWAETH